MTIKQILAMSLTLVLCGQSCTNDTPKTPPQTPPITNAPNTSGASNTQVPTENASTKPAEKTSANQAMPDKESKAALKIPGPIAYITREQVVLQTEPKSTSPTICPLKLHENIYILETIMTDDKGNTTQLPTWYKVELTNKKRGWVSAKAVDAGGGG